MSCYVQHEKSGVISRISNSKIDSINILFLSFKNNCEIIGAISFVDGRPKNNLIVKTAGSTTTFYTLPAHGRLNSYGIKFNGNTIIPFSWIYAVKNIDANYHVAAGYCGNNSSEIGACLKKLAAATKIGPMSVAALLGVATDNINNIARSLIPPIFIRRHVTHCDVKFAV